MIGYIGVRTGWGGATLSEPIIIQYLTKSYYIVEYINIYINIFRNGIHDL